MGSSFNNDKNYFTNFQNYSWANHELIVPLQWNQSNTEKIYIISLSTTEHEHAEKLRKTIKTMKNKHKTTPPFVLVDKTRIKWIRKNNTKHDLHTGQLHLLNQSKSEFTISPSIEYNELEHSKVANTGRLFLENQPLYCPFNSRSLRIAGASYFVFTSGVKKRKPSRFSKRL